MSTSGFPWIVLLSILPFSSLRGAVEEQLLTPHYVVNFQGQTAYDASRRSSTVRADTRPGGQPQRIVMEFALPAGVSPQGIKRATFSIVRQGWSAGGGDPHIALFAYGGDGILSVGEGLGGDLLKGPYSPGDFSDGEGFNRVDVLPTVREAMAAGHTHLGFAVRATDTQPGFRSDGISFSTAATSMANSRPPLLVLHLDAAAPAQTASAPAAPRPATVSQASPVPLPQEPMAATTAAEGRLPTPLHHWSFDPLDSDTYGHWIGSAAYDRNDAVIGPGSFRSNNNGYLWTLDDGPEGTQPRTISLWFKTNASTGQDDTLIGWGATANRQRYDFRLDGNGLRIEIGNTGHTFSARGIRDQEWHHALLSYSGGALAGHELYVDGRRIGGASGSVFLNTGTQEWIRIGTGVQRNEGGASTARDYAGRLDDVVIYEEALDGADAALIHGIGRHLGLDVGKLEAFRLLFEGPEDEIVALPGSTWVRSGNLAGPLGASGGSIAAGDAHVVLDEAGAGIRAVPPGDLSIEDGTIHHSVGFGQSAEVAPRLRHEGSEPAAWKVLWDDTPGLLQLESVADAVAARPEHFLGSIPDLLPSGYIENRNRIYFNNRQINYTPGTVEEAEFGDGTARYFTRTFDGCLVMVADTVGVDDISLADNTSTTGDIADFPVVAPDGTDYRAFYRYRNQDWNEDPPAVHELILVPDVPTVSAGKQPFKVVGLPGEARIYHLSFRRAPGRLSSPELARQFVRRFMEILANGPSWASATLPVGTLGPDAERPVTLELNAAGLAPGRYATRYAIAPFGTLAGDVAGEAWQDLTLEVGEPDFTLPEPSVGHVNLAGSIPDSRFVPLDPTGPGNLEITALSSSQPWVTPVVSASSPNGIDLRFQYADLAPGSHTAWITIDTATTRQVLEVRLTVQEQNIVRMEPDPGRNRVYALHRPLSGPGRLLAYDAAEGTLTGSLELDEQPDDFSLRPDGSELLVYHHSGWLWRIDPDSLEQTARRNFSALAEPDSPYDASIAAGPDGLAYLTTPQVYYRPDGKLHVIRLDNGEVLQQLEAPTEVLYDAGRRALFTWHDHVVIRFAVDGQGRLDEAQQVLVPLEADAPGESDRRLHLSRDGRQLVSYQTLVNPDNLRDRRVMYPFRIGATTPNHEVVTAAYEYRDPVTYDYHNVLRLLDARTAEPLAELDVDATLQEIGPDYERLFYFDNETKRVVSVELASLVEPEALGLRFEPGNGSTVLPPDILRWIPRTDAASYRVYLAGSAAEIEVETPDPELALGTPRDAWLEVDPARWQLGAGAFWRVDTVLADGAVVRGEIRSFQVSGLVPELDSLALKTAAGIDGRIETLEVAVADPSTPWTANGSEPWLIPTTRDGSLEVRIDATALEAGDYHGQVTLEQGGQRVEIPVVLWAREIQLQQVLTAPGTPYFHLRSQYRGHSFLLRFNTDEERFDRVAELPSWEGDPVYGSPTRVLAYHPADQRIYLVYGDPVAIATFDTEAFELIRLPRRVAGLDDFYRFTSSRPLSAGAPGELLGSGTEPWRIDIDSMSTVGPSLRGPDDTTVVAQSYDSTGGFLYSDVRRTDGETWLAKYRIEPDGLTEITSTPVSSYSYGNDEPLLVSPDGSRIYRGREIYDSDLQQIGRLRPNYQYSWGFRPLLCTHGGEVVTQGAALYNGTNGLELGDLPGQSGPYAALAPDQRRLFQFRWRDPGFTVTDLHERTALTGEDVVPGIEDGGVLFNAGLPLTWEPDPRAVAYRVFIGDDEQSVRDATENDPEFAGRTFASSVSPHFLLQPDRTYFWRIDIIGYQDTHKGSTISFHTAPFNTLPLAYSSSGPVEVPLGEQSLTLESDAAVAWTASTSTPWIKLVDEAGTTPGGLRFSFDTTGLGADIHEGTITLSAGGRSWEYPVTLDLERTNVIMARHDAARDRILAISLDGDDTRYRDFLFNTYLIVYDDATGLPLRSLPVGTSVSDLVIHEEENRLYLAHWKTGRVRALDLDSLEEVDLFQYTPYNEDEAELAEVHTLTAWKDGRLLMSGPANPSRIRIIDTADGSILDAWWPEPLAIGPGTRTVLPGGRYAIHSESPYTNNHIFKIDLAGDRIEQVTDNFHPGTFSSAPSLAPVLVSDDGSKIYSGRGLFDTDLNLLQTLPSYAVSLVPGEQFMVATEGLYNLATGERVQYNGIGEVIVTTSEGVWVFRGNRSLPTGYTFAEALGFGPDEKITPGIDDGALLIGTGQELSWEPDARAAGYRVYLGTDAGAVASAGPGSPEDIGFTTGSSMAAPLSLGTEYFWRIDAIGFGDPHPGDVHSFRTTLVEIDPSSLRVFGLSGVPIKDRHLNVTAPTPTTWNASTEASWLSLFGAPGTTAGTLTARIDPADFSNNQTYSAAIRFAVTGQEFDLPVEASIASPQPLHATADRERPFVYFTTGTTHNSYRDQPAFLIVVDAITEQPVKAIPVGSGAAAHVAIHYPENRIYVSNPTLGQTFVIDRDSHEVVGTLPVAGNLQPAREGRAVLTGGSYSVRVPLIDTGSGAELSRSFFDGHPHYWDLQAGSGTFDPEGRHLYYGERAGDMIRFDTEGDRMWHDAAFHRGEGNPGSHVLRSENGNRYFWGGHVLDPNLNLLWDFSRIAPGNFGNFARQVDPDGKRIFAWDTLDVIRVFDFEKRRYLFRLHQSREGDAVAYSPVVDKLFDMAGGRVHAVRFEPPIAPLAAPPGLVWASGGMTPWHESPDAPGTMVSTPQPVFGRGSLCAVHVPTAATVSFQGRGSFSASLGDNTGVSVSETPEWQTYRIEVPSGGSFITWYASTSPGYIRDIAILRSGPVRIDDGKTVVPPPDDPAVDTDLDGVPDVIEWMTGGDAADPLVSRPLRTSIEGDEFVVRFKRKLNLEGGSLVLQGSTDLDAWETYGFPTVLQVDIDGTYETLEARFPMDGPNHYFRLHATSAP